MTMKRPSTRRGQVAKGAKPNTRQRFAPTGATLSFKPVQALQNRLQLPEPRLAEILGLNPRTIKRNKDEDKITELTAHRVDFVAATTSLAEELLGNKEEARVWLTTPVLATDNKAPLDLLVNLEGYERVRDTLYQYVYGVY
jgi:putative toxin-antitoxin system antitoxin component (TIGR02293 family)